MNQRLRRRAGCVVTMLLLLLLVLGGARPTLSAPQTGEPTSGWTNLVSVAVDGASGDRSSGNPSITALGRYVAFDSWAADLVPGDSDGKRQIFVRDRETGMMTPVSVASDGEQANSSSSGPSISAWGRYVAFESYATNLVEGDDQLCDMNWDGFPETNCPDIFVHDRETGETRRISVASDGTQGNGSSRDASMAALGRFVAFASITDNLVDDDYPGGCELDGDWDYMDNCADIFVHDLDTGLTTRVSVNSDGNGAWGGPSGNPSISALGRYVAFDSHATNLTDHSDTNDAPGVFVHDRQTGETTCVSVNTAGEVGDGWSSWPAISALGRYVAFSSNATDLVGGGNSLWDVYVHDRQTDETTQVSVASDGTPGNSHSSRPSISQFGRYVAFESDASNLVDGDDNSAEDIFVHDRNTGETWRVSVASDGTQGDCASEWPSISSLGSHVAFESCAALAQADTDTDSDIYLHGPWSRTYLPLVSKDLWKLWIRLGEETTGQGLTLNTGGDVDTYQVLNIGYGIFSRMTGNGSAIASPDGNHIPDYYMEFDVDDSAIYASPPGTRLGISVTYWDAGFDTFSVQYDARSGGPFGDGLFRETENVTKTNSPRFLTHTFWIDDVYFANRDNGADFRIDDHGDGGEIIYSVTVHP